MYVGKKTKKKTKKTKKIKNVYESMGLYSDDILRDWMAISLPLAPSSNNDDGGVKEREQKIPVLVDEFDIL
jgi:hypothetical protein